VLLGPSFETFSLGGFGLGDVLAAVEREGESGGVISSRPRMFALIREELGFA